MSSPILLSARGIEKTYTSGERAVHALRGVSFDLEPGAFASLMGPSGCGKTTLLHLLGAMDRPTSGSITLDGERIDSLRETELALLRRQKIGFIFQFFNLLPTLRLIENVALPLILDGVPRREALDRATALVERVGLAERSTHFPAELSGGEMQRGAVARALVSRPQLVLADEPTGSLDSENSREVLDLLGEIHRELGVTILVATHAEEVARRTTKRIRMRDGRIDSIERVEAVEP